MDETDYEEKFQSPVQINRIGFLNSNDVKSSI